MNPDDASMAIIIDVWTRLRREYGNERALVEQERLMLETFRSPKNQWMKKKCA
jgi:hypothetical protein